MMRANFTIIWLLVGLAIFVRADSGKLTGAVRDSEGAVIANSIVLVHGDAQGADAPRGATAGLRKDLRLTTNSMGVFSVELAPGFYDVVLFAHAFSPNAHKVRIRNGQTVSYDAKLLPDPQITAEFGDEFVKDPAPLMPSPEPKRQY
jgi:hypothetical protein